ncbi:hypothetical protein ACT009_08775 [Sphingomonas sp. Tas61C01]|uniref:hypothetical protein n=1 Tax=Sphingomonas sp. Tas61C01 TaxID=3458297 RepID=UPI00403E4FAD
MHSLGAPGSAPIGILLDHLHHIERHSRAIVNLMIAYDINLRPQSGKIGRRRFDELHRSACSGLEKADGILLEQIVLSRAVRRVRT